MSLPHAIAALWRIHLRRGCMPNCTKVVILLVGFCALPISVFYLNARIGVHFANSLQRNTKRRIFFFSVEFIR